MPRKPAERRCLLLELLGAFGLLLRRGRVVVVFALESEGLLSGRPVEPGEGILLLASECPKPVVGQLADAVHLGSEAGLQLGRAVVAKQSEILARQPDQLGALAFAHRHGELALDSLERRASLRVALG